MTADTDQHEPKCLILHQEDNTVTALQNLRQGEVLSVVGPERETVTLHQDIPYAHKFARTFIAQGDDVLKYGEVIGIATADIQAGEHVHVHNVVGKRAQGTAE